MLIEFLRNGRVVIDELDENTESSGADVVHGFHIQTNESRREWDKKNLTPSSEAALIREIQRQCPDWEPGV